MKALEHINRCQDLYKIEVNLKRMTEQDFNIIIDYARGLFTYAKFNVGQHVVLKKTPIIDEVNSFGWIGYKDILIEGNKAIIQEVDWLKGHFRYHLKFKDVDGLFCFNEDYLDAE